VDDVRQVYLFQDGKRLLGPLDLAETLWERTRGLIGRDAIEGRRGMVIPRCGLIHTCFVRFPIDAVFLSRDGTVVKVKSNMKPWRASGTLFANRTVEIRAGLAGELGLRAGRKVELREDGSLPDRMGDAP